VLATTGGKKMGILKECECKNFRSSNSNNCFMGKPEDWQARFALENQGKLVCYACGGFYRPNQSQ